MSTKDQEMIETLKVFAEKVGRLGQLSLADEVMKKLRGAVKWTDGAWFGLFQFHFAYCLRAIVLALHFMRKVNEDALEQLSDTS